MMKFKGYSKIQIIDIYRKMVLSRYLDDKQLILLKQGKGFFHIGGSGHEAAGIAAATCFKPGHDYAYPYYRDQAFCIGWGMTSREHLLSFLAKENDPSSGGRQMPQHYGHYDLNLVSQSSPTGTQFLQAVGASFALSRNGDHAVVYVSAGEGTTSQGDFHESLNWASRDKSPVIFHIQNNQYAISVPIKDQIAGGSVYKISAGYENLARFNVDGTDYFETQIAFNKAVDRARKGKGPSIVISDVVRLLPHSSSDDQRKYRSENELNLDLERDPLLQFKNMCQEAGIVDIEDFNKINNDVKEQVDNDAEWAETQKDPIAEDNMKNIYHHSKYSEMVEPPANQKENIVMVDAINHALDEELTFNDKMLLYGQDIAGDKGGVFTATRGLTDKFGEKRVFNSPLAESSIIGTAIGMATLGFKPVVEIQFGDYIWYGMMQIRNELATMRYRSNGKWSCPVVIRVPVGGYIHGALCHSQSIDGYFTHLPGLYVAYPSNASDAKGLLKMACRMKDPVMFMEHKGLYRQGFASSLEPDKDYILPFGKANIVQEGNSLTIITWGALVQKSIEASKNTSIQTEIIDLRTLNPLDMDTILTSIEKTNRALIVYEDNLTNGFGAEISAIIADEGFELLDAPLKRVGSLDAPVAYSPILENSILVQTNWIEQAILEVSNY